MEFRIIMHVMQVPALYFLVYLTKEHFKFEIRSAILVVYEMLQTCRYYTHIHTHTHDAPYL